jgi:transcriptional regulator with XRE-family HTH domain
LDDSLARIAGERIKRLRTQSGLSLREQARVLGISASSLSALENSRGGMSLGRLQIVAQHFGLHITDLLRPQENAQAAAEPDLEIFTRSARAKTSIRRGKDTIYQLLGSGHGHDIQPAIVTFEPGGGYQQDLMGHAGEEFAFVVLGDVELINGDEVHTLGPGDSVRFRASKPHGYRNASDTDMALIVTAATPPW